MKKILFPFRFNQLKDESDNPTEYLYGVHELKQKKIFNIDCIFEPRGKLNSISRVFLWILEQPFVKAVKLGMPFGSYWFHRKQYKNIDIVVCINDAISFSTLFWKNIGVIDSKVITIFQALPDRYNKFFKHKKVFVWVVKKLLMQSDKILVLSSSAKYELSKVFNVPLKKIEVFYFGTDLNYWKYKKFNTNKRSYILTIGNDMNRDYDTFCANVPNKYKSIIVSSKKIICDGVEVRNGISNKEVRQLYYGARLVVIPSVRLLTESSGLRTAVQSMACGTPVLISDSVAMRELFKENEEIFYFEPEDSDKLLGKIDMIWGNKELLSRVSISARQKILSRLNTVNMADQLEKIVNEV